MGDSREMALHQSLLLLTFIPLAAALFAAPSTNVCGLEYNYCSKDPGCATYTMSVHDLLVQDLNSSKPVNISDVSLGSHLKLTVTGKTTITTVTKDGSYRIYALQGGNLAGGVLADVLTIDGKGGFAVSVEFAVGAELFNAKDKSKFEFGLDIFQNASGTFEGMCVEVASSPYVAAEQGYKFEFLCKDGGDGHFEVLKVPIPMPSYKVQAASCTAPTPAPTPAPPAPTPAPTSSCSLQWYYCKLDPGCVTYTMSAVNVSFSTGNKTGYAVGDHATLYVTGTTTLTAAPVGGSYRIYTLSGHNGASGVLTDVLTLPSTGHFALQVPYTIAAGSFGDDGQFEFGLDIFQNASGSNEGMCVEVGNPTYVTAMQARPGFNMGCIDHGGGHFEDKLPKGVPEKVSAVKCTTE